MESFKEFVRRTVGARLAIPAGTTAGALATTGFSLVRRDAEAVDRAVSDILNDDAFLTHLSDQLPVPSDQLSEEDFVTMARQVARRLLIDRLRLADSENEVA
ncbi:MAG: hypothetical protein HYU51_00360 [Candidatus Rokubacteria bacterium]|nr:hypothetical protein [Candidatus Rokubacteria bacterium]